jgi:uncharacterized protein with GYD domain
MPTYIGLFKLTDKGIQNIKNAPGRIEEAFKAVEAMGGKLIDFYAVMGEYDYVGIAEFPSDEAQMTFALGLSSRGDTRGITLKAFSKEEFTKMVEKLP